MKTINSATELRKTLGAWCKAPPDDALNLTMTAGGVPLMIRGGVYFGVRTATCAALLAKTPGTETLMQAGHLALGNVALYEAGLALDETSHHLWLSHTLHDPSPQTICSALSALRAQTRTWQRTLAEQSRRRHNTRQGPSALQSMRPS